MSWGPTRLGLLLGALAGLRAGEIAALDMADVDLDAKPPILIVRNGKGSKDRIVPLHPLLVQHLGGRKGVLFPGLGANTHVRSSSMSALLSRALTKAGGGERRYVCHQLRHFFGTSAAQWSNGNLILVGQLMGHESPTTTQGYVGWSPTEGAEVVSKIVAPGQADDELARRRVQRMA